MAVVLLAALAATAVNLPIVRNFFFADDFEHLVFLANYGPLSFIAQPHAGHMYLVRNTVYWLHHALFQMNPVGYFACALATHVLNVVLLFALARRVTGSVAAACLGAVLFGVSPTNAGTLGWYSVYGHALAATWTLMALLLVVGPAPPPLGRVLGAAACMIAASQSFGTGAALALVFPLLVAVLRPSAFRRPTTAVVLCAVPVIVGAALCGFYFIQTRSYPDPALQRRWLAATGMAVGPIAAMVRHTASAGIVQLVLGAAYPVDRYPDAVSTATLVFCGAAVAWAFAVASRQARGAILVFLGAALACYLAIAEGRAVFLGAMAAPGELAHHYAGMPRYHYLAQAMLAVVIALVVAEIGRRAARWPRATNAVFAAWGIAAVATGLVAGRDIDHHDVFRAAYTAARDDLEAELRRQPPGETICIANRPAIPWPGAPGIVAVFVLEHATDVVDGRRVFFMSTDPVRDLEQGRDRGGRLERLLRTPDDCPPAGPAR